MYKAIKANGHDVYLVASTSNESGTGGTVIFTTAANLTADTEFGKSLIMIDSHKLIPSFISGIVKAGSPSVGTDPSDSHIWYYNGTPSACVQVALDYILPNFANFSTPDIVMSGPNFGWNLGPFLYTLSGTIGATYTAVERGIPGIAFSGGYSVQTPYFLVNSTTAAGLKDPATIQGQLAANLLQQLIVNNKGGRLLPLGYGISVNIPYITSFTNSSCINPPFIQTRMTGSADVDGASYNATSGLFAFKDVVPAGANQCINGDCSLPGETAILNTGCQTSVSVFTVDYDAPLQCHTSPDIRSLLLPLVQYANSTNLVGGLNATSSGINGTSPTSTPTPTSSPIAVTTGGAGLTEVPVIAAVLAVAFALMSL
jgi:5'-nucleotidase